MEIHKKLIHIYEAVINNEELTKDKLESYGLTSREIEELIASGYFETKSDNRYIFIHVTELYRYGTKLERAKSIEESTRCFEKCCEINPQYEQAYLQLFYNSIRQRDFFKALHILTIFPKTDNPQRVHDINLYLFLLNIITDIPEEYSNYVNTLTFDDVRVIKRTEDTKERILQNRIRTAIIRKKLAYAIQLLLNLTNYRRRVTIEELILKNLTIQARDIQRTSRNELYNLVVGNNYQEVIEYLYEKLSKKDLDMLEKTILKLVETIIYIEETGEIPEIEVVATDKVFEAIDGNNYQLALELENQMNEKYGVNESSPLISILLTKICNLIEAIQKEQNKEKNASAKETRPIEDMNSSLENESNQSQTKNMLSKLYEHLENEDFDKAFEVLEDYLKSIQKEAYKFIIIDLIKLSIIGNDKTFTRPLITLSTISTTNFNLSEYIEEFHLCLSRKNLDEARIYLDIIAKICQLKEQNIIIDELTEIENAVEEMLDSSKTSTSLDKLNISIAKLRRKVLNNSSN